MSAPQEDGTAGFVLLETIVAFLVLAVALTAAIATISQGSLSIRRAGEADLAAEVAREVAAVRLPALAAAGTLTGELRGAPWRLDARSLDDESRFPLYAVTITVRPPGAARPFTFRSFAAGEPRGAAP